MKVYKNRYRKVQEIGRGAYGKINLAEDLDPETQAKYVAIKQLMVNPNTGIDFVSIREIKILKELDHPNIIKLRDVFVEQGNIYLVMDCLVCDLGKLIDTPKVTITEADTVTIFKQLVEGVAFLHKHWILHRVDRF